MSCTPLSLTSPATWDPLPWMAVQQYQASFHWAWQDQIKGASRDRKAWQEVLKNGSLDTVFSHHPTANIGICSFTSTGSGTCYLNSRCRLVHQEFLEDMVVGRSGGHYHDSRISRLREYLQHFHPERKIGSFVTSRMINWFIQAPGSCLAF